MIHLAASPHSRLFASWLFIFGLACPAWGADDGPWSIDTTQCPITVPFPLQNHGRFGCPVPIDGSVESNPDKWSPWTHPPRCVNSPHISNLDYCVFTNSQHGIGGISILTTPQIAAASLDILNEPITPDVPLNLTENGDFDSPYEIIDVPGKGKGVIASRPISRYETIMFDYASIVVDIRFPSAVRREQGYPLLHHAADQLGNPQRVYSLDKSNPSALDDIENVLRTNAFQADLAAVDHMALFPLVSRINHDCKPNAFQRFVPRSLGITVGAARDIQAGEEITISYLTAAQPSAERKAGLRKWGFKCSCKLCTASAEEIAASDSRRLKLRTDHEQQVQAHKQGDLDRAIELTYGMLKILEEEDLFRLVSEQYENLGRLYWAKGDRKNGEKYARMSLDELYKQGFAKYQPHHLGQVLRSFENDSEYQVS